MLLKQELSDKIFGKIKGRFIKMISRNLREKLSFLAEKYETPDFINNDPSKFMHQFSEQKDAEAVAFLAANMAFGQRKQILSHVDSILQVSGTDFVDWVQNEGYRSVFTKGDSSFYRVYTHDAMNSFFDTMKQILDTRGTLENHFKVMYDQKRVQTDCDKLYLAPVICNCFDKNCTLIPHGKDSACKKVNMFLRWMVRDNSPVDLGLWTWYGKENLLLPLDVHVMQEATKLGLLAPTSTGRVQSASMKNAVVLSNIASEIFPGDPAKLDYALFGLGVDDSNS